MKESSEKVKPWRADVRHEAQRAMDDQHWSTWEDGDQPLSIDVTFWMPRPKSHPKTRRTLPDRMPDLDKLLRSTFDALKSAGVCADDARFVRILATKRYVHPAGLRHPSEPETTGARIHIRPESVS
jgi:Holliday junction resolvase RusA-like endonuclease